MKGSQMFSLLQAQHTDQIFGQSPFEFFFGLIVIVLCLAVVFWVARNYEDY